MSELAHLEARWIGACFASEPVPPGLVAPAEESRLRLYRDMVRGRVLQLCAEVLPRTRTSLGPALFAELVGAWLAEVGPRSRFFRDLPELFAAHLLAQGGLPPLARDLLRLERARWRATIAPDAAPVRPFALDAIPAPHPSLSVFEADHAVQAGGGDAPHRTLLAVYRRPDLEVEVRWSAPTFHALLARWARSEELAIDSVRAVLAAEGRAPTPAFVDEMSAFLAELLERGALVGSR
jgi:hypothetical protein